MNTERRDEYDELSAGQQAYGRRFSKAVDRLDNLERVEHDLVDQGRDLFWIKVSFKGGGVGEYMVVCKSLSDDGSPEICFEGASSPVLALDKMLRKLRAGDCRWKVDQYHGS
jgi:hypothetical protein